MIKLRTERLIISDHNKGDIDSLHKLLSNLDAMYYLPDLRTTTIEESQQNLNVSISEIDLDNRKKYYFKIEYAHNYQYLGEIGFTERLNTPQGKIVSLGYFILPEFWGNGITTEAVKEVIRFAFEELNVMKIETGCIKENSASESIMKKAGMIKEADYMLYVWHDNKLKDRVEYRLLKEEWKASLIK